MLYTEYAVVSARSDVMVVHIHQGDDVFQPMLIFLVPLDESCAGMLSRSYPTGRSLTW